MTPFATIKIVYGFLITPIPPTVPDHAYSIHPNCLYGKGAPDAVCDIKTGKWVKPGSSPTAPNVNKCTTVKVVPGYVCDPLTGKVRLWINKSTPLDPSSQSINKKCTQILMTADARCDYRTGEIIKLAPYEADDQFLKMVTFCKRNITACLITSFDGVTWSTTVGNSDPPKAPDPPKPPDPPTNPDPPEKPPTTSEIHASQSIDAKNNSSRALEEARREEARRTDEAERARREALAAKEREDKAREEEREKLQKQRIALEEKAKKDAASAEIARRQALVALNNVITDQARANAALYQNDLNVIRMTSKFSSQDQSSVMVNKFGRELNVNKRIEDAGEPMVNYFSRYPNDQYNSLTSAPISGDPLPKYNPKPLLVTKAGEGNNTPESAYMLPQLADKVHQLAVAVRAYNPDFSLRVVEAFDTDIEHGSGPLDSRRSTHYEGRGVDLTIYNRATNAIIKDVKSLTIIVSLARNLGFNFGQVELFTNQSRNHAHVSIDRPDKLDPYFDSLGKPTR